MAKESMKARERKRAKTVAKYAEKRKALKEAGDYEGLQKLPKNASPILKRKTKPKIPKAILKPFFLKKLIIGPPIVPLTHAVEFARIPDDPNFSCIILLTSIRVKKVIKPCFILTIIY